MMNKLYHYDEALEHLVSVDSSSSGPVRIFTANLLYFPHTEPSYFSYGSHSFISVDLHRAKIRCPCSLCLSELSSKSP